MALPTLLTLEHALATPPSKGEIQIASNAWRTFQWRWLRAYGTGTVTTTVLFGLADGLFEMNNVNEFGKFLASLASREVSVNRWCIAHTGAGYRLYAD